jgi:two-component system, chemotaxis family, CheB/CheR fusion protein
VVKRRAKPAIPRSRARRSATRRPPAGAASPAASGPQTGVAPERARQLKDDRFLVVGLGASAGGLEAVRKLLAALPADTGFAFVLIQHLDPSHRSMLVELLARDTTMKVAQAADGMPIERNCLYVIPPHADLVVRNGLLQISQPQEREGLHLPFDSFLRSLAEDYGPRAVAVILSGTGNDGSVGLKAISEKGGLVIAQEPQEAAFDGMPRSAIATGAVDLVLPAANIPHALIQYAQQHPSPGAGRKAAPQDEVTDKSLAAIVDLLRSRTSQDFAHYKKGTLVRRIQRRMALAKVKEIDNYIETLREDGHELELLARELLIHVTSFFRDPAAFAALAKTVIPQVVRQHAGDQPIRAWVPGCSSGEEAYSIAMLFFEEFAAAQRSLKLQIFASDVSPEAIAHGRSGLYPGSIKADVSAERLARFFTREDQGYRVTRNLRDSITFTVQDVLTDPPLSRLDLISCRNLLIYLQPDEQEKVLSLFHFALREGGLLFLGASETTGKLADYFEPVPDTLRAFRRVGPSRPRERTLAPNVVERARSLWPRVAAHVEPKRPNLADLVQQALVEAYAPAAVLVNRRHQGLYFFGPTDRYLHVATGEPSRHLPAMLRPGLASKFRAAARQASQDHAAATVRGAQVRRNGGSVAVSICARPLQYEGEELLLITFADEPKQKAVVTTGSPAETARVEQIEEELEATRKDLETTIRELESSNQELTALNEEAVSMNEEFQSTNEELETSREELQSLNEELTTVNSQLQESLERERQTSNDLKNILNSSLIATVFLDKNLNIRFFTPAAAPLFNLIATDIGRPLGDLLIRFSGVDLLADARNVLENLQPIKREIRSGAGAWYVCGASPYRTTEKLIEGVVINLVDISDLKAGEEGLRLARVHAEYIEAIINTIREPLVVLDAELRVISASQSFYQFFRCTPGQTVGRLLPDTDAHHLDTPALRALIDRIKNGDRSIKDYEMAIDLPPAGRRTLVLTAEDIQEAENGGRRILISFNDITASKDAALQLAAAKRTAEQANLAKSRFLAAASHDLRQPLQTLSLLHGALKQRVTDKEAQSLLARAERTSETMANLLSTLLDINQLETGAIRPTLTDFPVNDLLAAMSEEFAERAQSKGLRWRLVSCDFTVRSDRRLLDEIVRNLLSNAVRYTDAGGILLGCRRREDRLRIEVWDTGIGISEEQIPRIFEEYRQAAGVAPRGGLGLGLAIVQHLGELLGHPIGVRSRRGKGSVFSIDVPLAGATPLPAAAPEVPHRAAARRTGVVLVIEDEDSARESLAAMLEAEGHRVITAANGPTALNAVGRDGVRPELVISDYNLPGESNGVQIATALRSTLGWQVPVIILSGDVRPEKLRNIAGSGCVSVIKPIKASELAQLVQQFLTGARAPATAPLIAAPTAESQDATTAVTVFVVDDDRDTREAMQVLLSDAGYRVKAFGSASAFLSAHNAGERGCLITDVRMPGMNGLEMLARLAAMGSKIPAVIITGQGDIAMAVEAMRAGANDFIEKPVDPETLLTSVSRAFEQAATPAERSARRAEAAMRIAGLTKREREVMRLVVAGRPNKEIATRLRINQRTVESHRATVMKKLRVRSLSDLVRLAIAAGGVMPPSER